MYLLTVSSSFLRFFSTIISLIFSCHSYINFLFQAHVIIYFIFSFLSHFLDASFNSPFLLLTFLFYIYLFLFDAVISYFMPLLPILFLSFFMSSLRISRICHLVILLPLICFLFLLFVILFIFFLVHSISALHVSPVSHLVLLSFISLCYLLFINAFYQSLVSSNYFLQFFLFPCFLHLLASPSNINSLLFLILLPATVLFFLCFSARKSFVSSCFCSPFTLLTSTFYFFISHSLHRVYLLFLHSLTFWCVSLRYESFSFPSFQFFHSSYPI